MTGLQGYRISEVFRQISNSFEEWDTERSEHYFSGVISSEYMKYVNASGGKIEADARIWR